MTDLIPPDTALATASAATPFGAELEVGSSSADGSTRAVPSAPLDAPSSKSPTPATDEKASVLATSVLSRSAITKRAAVSAAAVATNL